MEQDSAEERTVNNNNEYFFLFLKMLQSQESEAQQLGVWGDLTQSHVSWVLEVTAGLQGLQGEEAE